MPTSRAIVVVVSGSFEVLDRNLRNPLISRKAVLEAFWPPRGAERRAVSSHGEHGATSFSIIRNPEPALRDSSYESRRRDAPTSSCILALEKIRGSNVNGGEISGRCAGVKVGHFALS
jgi:hypothetical protein